MWPFKKNKQLEIDEKFFSYFKLESGDDGKSELIADIKDEDVKRWLYNVTRHIQKAFSKHEVIKNYLVGQFILGGQKIEFAFVKEFKEGPYAMLQEAKLEIENLKKENEKLKILLKMWEEK